MPIEYDYTVDKLVEDYLAERENEVRESTLTNHTYNLRAFARWADDGNAAQEQVRGGTRRSHSPRRSPRLGLTC